MNSISYLSTILFVILFLFSCQKSPTSSDSVAVLFPDTSFETLIREIFNKPTDDIFNTDLDTIPTISGREREISDISGIEYYTSLENYRSMSGIILINAAI